MEISRKTTLKYRSLEKEYGRRGDTQDEENYQRFVKLNEGIDRATFEGLQECVAVLDERQKALWGELIGKPFSFDTKK